MDSPVLGDMQDLEEVQYNLISFCKEMLAQLESMEIEPGLTNVIQLITVIIQLLIEIITIYENPSHSDEQTGGTRIIPIILFLIILINCEAVSKLTKFGLKQGLKQGEYSHRNLITGPRVETDALTEVSRVLNVVPVKFKELDKHNIISILSEFFNGQHLKLINRFVGKKLGTDIEGGFLISIITLIQMKDITAVRLLLWGISFISGSMKIIKKYFNTEDRLFELMNLVFANLTVFAFLQKNYKWLKIIPKLTAGIPDMLSLKGGAKRRFKNKHIINGTFKRIRTSKKIRTFKRIRTKKTQYFYNRI